ncbi:hypothetical protein [Streptomyces hiroshimensis]
MAPHPHGRGAERAIRAALEDGACDPADVNLVHAHGTSTPLNDAAEAAALSEQVRGPPPTPDWRLHPLHAIPSCEAGPMRQARARAVPSRRAPRRRSGTWMGGSTREIPFKRLRLRDFAESDPWSRVRSVHGMMRGATTLFFPSLPGDLAVNLHARRVDRDSLRGPDDLELWHPAHDHGAI